MAFPANSATSDNFSGWFSDASATVAPRTADCSFFSFFLAVAVAFLLYLGFDLYFGFAFQM
jgi:hypothetical protein